jgi:AcrR family transcriptional regulator
VHHYFGTKDALFLAAVEAPLDPADLVAGVLDGDRDELGERLVRMFLGVWEGPAREPGLALIRSAVAHEWSARLLRELLVTRVLRRVMAALDAPPDEREARAALVASQLAGVIMTRYLLRLEPIASASTEWLVATLAPTLQRYLTGDVVLPAHR